MSGHHGKVADWQKQQSEALTQQRRPDLWKEFNKSHKN